MMMDTILALGLLFTTSSQLRLAGLPLGPGELCLAGWIAVSFARQAFQNNMRQNNMRQNNMRMTRALSAMVFFWMLFAAALSLGTLMALATGENFETDLFMHDAIAYPLIAAVSLLSVGGASAAVRLHRVAWLVMLLGTMSLALQYANGMGIFAVPSVDPWYWERFRGWSSNPNQLAILCSVLTLVALHLADAAVGHGARFVALFCLIPAAVLGRLSQSDTFMLALAAGGLVYVTCKLIIWLRADGPAGSIRSMVARLTLIALPLLMLSFAPLALSAASDAGRFAMGFTKNGGAQVASEADLRFSLWGQAITRGVESGLLGLGPGPHLQIPSVLVESRKSNWGSSEDVVHPLQNGTANFEAHNTFLDLFTQGGALAVLSFSWLLLRATTRAYSTRSAGLVALIVGATVFGLTGLIIRQPIFWFAISLCITAEGVERAIPAAQSRAPAQGGEGRAFRAGGEGALSPVV